MSRLSDVYPEPPNGNLVVLLDEELRPFLVWRNDEEGEFGRGWITECRWDEPKTWSDATEGCLILHVIPDEPTALVPRL
jgi:hypothetical protein